MCRIESIKQNEGNCMILDAERVSDSNRNIKEILESKKYVIVLDTNIILKIYRTSPDYAEFVLKCLENIKEYVCIPFNVLWEYEKHRKEEYKKKNKSISNSVEVCDGLVSKIRNIIKCQCNELSKDGYPDIESLVQKMLENVDELENIFEKYFDAHQDLDFLNNWNQDKVLNIVESFEKMPEPTATFVYKQCQEGKYRYKNKIPPGYQDEKKDGVSKYGDLLVWAETYTYAATNGKNIILVTDDVKEDWWDKCSDGKILFREELIKEFSRKTKIGKEKDESLKLIPFIGYDFYKAIAREYNIESLDTISMILNTTDDAFVEAVEMKVFDSIWSEIAYSGTSYFDENGSHVGTEGVDEWELENVEFVDYERVDVDSGVAVYTFSYDIRIVGVSYDYWGRDDDTREVITSPGRTHECSGKVYVTVTRMVDSVIDWNEDFEYDNTEVQEVILTEESYEDEYSELDVYCSGCGERIGYEWDLCYHTNSGEPICEDCAVTNENGFICPGCGNKYPEEMRGGSGTYCIDCEEEYDV